MPRRTVRDLRDLKGTRVFVRVDYNVPVKDGRITDDTRIRASLPTLEHLTKGGARLVLASHLGRPKKGPAPEFSLAPVAVRLSELLGTPVLMATDCIGPNVQGPGRRPSPTPPSCSWRTSASIPRRRRTIPPSPRPSSRSSGATVFVNDAFGTAHRAHASTEGVSHFVKTSVAGLLMEKELRYLGLALEAPERPFVAVLGGAKVSDKIQVIESLLPRVDSLLVGGGMAYTFFRARGLATGKSLVEEDKVELAKGLLEKAKGKIHLPVDHVVASAFNADAERKTLPVSEIPEGWMGLDVGPRHRRRVRRRRSAGRSSCSGTGPWASSR